MVDIFVLIYFSTEIWKRKEILYIRKTLKIKDDDCKITLKMTGHIISQYKIITIFWHNINKNIYKPTTGKYTPTHKDNDKRQW
jgi:hypothetical protein